MSNQYSFFSAGENTFHLSPLPVKAGIALLALVAFTLIGCDQVDLNEAQPTTSVSLDQTISSESGFNGLIVSMYDRLQSPVLYGQQYMLYPDALADNVNLVPGSTTNRYPGVVANRAFAHFAGYGALYSTVNEANNIIEDIGSLDLSAENPQDVRDRIRGEALFLRGMAYFDLVRIYGYMPGSIEGRQREVDGFSLGVPLRTEPTRSAADAQPIPREQNTAIYNQALEDLNAADSLLSNNSDVRPAPNRATSATVSGLLSRVHLYLGNWSQAEQAATRALSLTGASVVDARSEDFEGAWEASTYPGSVFELSMQQGNDATTADNSLQTLTDGVGGGFFAYEVLPSSDVRSIYPSDDARRGLFATDPSGNVYLEKYTGTIAQFTDRIPLLRVAELYLNRAEARAQQGDDASGARSDLNYIRERRNLETVATDLSGQALVDSILVERRREFLFEGKRFFTLKRYARDIPKPQQGSDIDYDGPLRTDQRLILAPLPTGEVQSNPEVDQNPGY
jgi:tetratricopeptide (TPR) repeat protein